VEFVLCDDLAINGCKHCATLFIVDQRARLAPQVDDSSATITFVRFKGRTFGITCKHVVESLRNRIVGSNNEGSHVFMLDLRKRLIVVDRFIFPRGDWISPAPDIAIRELRPNLPEYIGKVTLDVEKVSVPPLRDIKFAVAVGFPDKLKEKRSDALGDRIAMPCVHALAENISSDGSSFSLRSELKDTPGVRDLSGLSGGPIYWTDANNYGLLGITYESAPMDTFAGSAAVHIIGHLADLETMERWTTQVI
jgi:hypothetical protein